ncbi:MAG: cation:dicarboxylase symporter family transporter [Bacteroidia bacterium]|jgi:proton glutamate symport protein|nr:cation:dicarboxylase symporter family transporter [Bacteroidia bacterium]MCC6767701.1 cation:dicarboxylase symporter family transporter [Bacteroidia bacterium]
MEKRKIMLLAWITGSVGIILTLLRLLHIVELPGELVIGFRWLAILSAGLYTYQRKSLTLWIFLFMLAGLELGHDWPEVAKPLKVLSDIFLRLIKTIIAPLIFSTLVVGIAGHSNLKQVGRMGLKAIIYFEVVTTIALFIGLAAINLTGAGRGSQLEAGTAQVERAGKLLEQKHEHNVILDIFPENIAKAVAENQVLQIVVFSILFGIALAMLKNGEKKQHILMFTEGLSEVMFKFTDIVMYFAPAAVGGAIAYSVATMGLGVLKDLLFLLLTLYGALIVFIMGVLVPIGWMTGLPFRRFINAIAEPVTIAFATASSEAALPKAMENLASKMGIPGKIIAFVLPTGYSFNLDGTTLYLSLASVFVAQACGIELTLAQQIQMCLILMLTSKGVAGVRGASFLILVSTVTSLGLDPQKAFAILAIDALMDMGRTSVNVIGNCLAAFVVARWEKEI